MANQLLNEIKAERAKVSQMQVKLSKDNEKAQSMDTIVVEFSKWLNANYEKLLA